MGTGEPAGGAADVALLAYRDAGSTALRMLVGARLRRMREAAGLTCEAAGATIRGSHSKISRMELGRLGFKRRDVADLLTVYGVGDEAERSAVLTLAEMAAAPPWWREYADIVPAWFEEYLGLEQAASVIRTYEVQFVPGLLQTEDYARAVIGLGQGDGFTGTIERRVALRARRQQLLRRPNPPKLWAVIDEGALRRPIGGREVMRAQLRHLIELAGQPDITIEVMPFSAGGHAAAGGPITLLRFAEADIRDVVYLEQLTNAYYSTKREDIELYWHILNQVVIDAEAPDVSVKILQRILRET